MSYFVVVDIVKYDEDTWKRYIVQQGLLQLVNYI